jgi:hypothetical protein
MEQKKINLIEAAVEFLSRGTSTNPLNEAYNEDLQLIEDIISEVVTAKNTSITLGGKSHPMNKIPIEHHAEFKKQYPGVRTRYRGKREKINDLQTRSGGAKGNYSGTHTQDTLKKDATHFYAHPMDVEAAGHKVK